MNKLATEDYAVFFIYLEIDKKSFRVNNEFLVGALIITGILVALYTVFW